MLYLPAISPSYIGGFTPTNYDFYDYFGEHPFGLLSAGHTSCKVTDFPFKSQHDPFLIGDSGGFQIGKGKWVAQWDDPACPKAKKYQVDTLTWLKDNFDYYMTLDIPLNTLDKPNPLFTPKQVFSGSKLNLDHWYHNSDHNVLNVLSGCRDWSLTEQWFDMVTPYSDPNKSHYFEGYGFGGTVVTNFRNTIKTLRKLADKNLITEAHKVIHMLGVSTLWKAYFILVIEEVLRERFNPNIMVTMDSASPFLIAAYGKICEPMSIKDCNSWAMPIRSVQFPHTTEDAADVLQDVYNIEAAPDTFQGIESGILRNKKGGWTTDCYSRVMKHNLHEYREAFKIIETIYETNQTVPLQIINKETKYFTKNKFVMDLFEFDGYVGNPKEHLLDLLNQVFDAPSEADAFNLIDNDPLMKELIVK